LAAALINAAFIVPIYWPMAHRDADGRALRLVVFNVLTRNPLRERVVDYLRTSEADVVLILEVDEAWAESLASLRDVYPHQHLVPRDDNFGMALLSRLSWTEIETLELGNSEVPTLVAKFVFGQQVLTFVGTHLLPPGSRLLSELRNQQLRDVAALCRELAGPVILAGDLNITSFSPFFRDLVAASGLRDSRPGRGVQASRGPLPVLEIAIDHCLISSEIAVSGRCVGPHLGSDHRPVIVDMRLPAAGQKSAGS
jgi:endonuclease/exonuclease/phosphatase (EEP) superfamily protein YafD